MMIKNIICNIKFILYSCGKMLDFKRDNIEKLRYLNFRY